MREWRYTSRISKEKTRWKKVYSLTPYAVDSPANSLVIPLQQEVDSFEYCHSVSNCSPANGIFPFVLGFTGKICLIGRYDLD
jgi:hypothetical protein